MRLYMVPMCEPMREWCARYASDDTCVIRVLSYKMPRHVRYALARKETIARSPYAAGHNWVE
jgi:hypothetical protein